jgi:uncharacterized protein (UPF0548 family)
MGPLLQPPSPQQLDALLKQLERTPLSYPEAGATAGAMPLGYDHDDNRIKLGADEEVFEAAKNAILDWGMFPEGWTQLFPRPVTLYPGAQVVVMFRLMGMWWVNTCRVVYIVNEADVFGFAYGTLPGHVEQGEELFLVERDQNGDIWYRIRAFSRPQHWLALLGYPATRWHQRRFVRDSLEAMKERVKSMTAAE